MSNSRSKPTILLIVLVMLLVGYMSFWLWRSYAKNDSSPIVSRASQEKFEFLRAIGTMEDQTYQRAEALSDAGKNRDAGFMFADVAGLEHLVPLEPNNRVGPSIPEIQALQQFEMSGDGGTYRRLLRLRYPGCFPSLPGTAQSAK